MLSHALTLGEIAGSVLVGVVGWLILFTLFRHREGRNLEAAGLLILLPALAIRAIGRAQGVSGIERFGDALVLIGGGAVITALMFRWIVGVMGLFGLGPMARKRRPSKRVL